MPLHLSFAHKYITLKHITFKHLTLPYKGTSLIINSAALGPYSRTAPRALWCSYGGGLFLMSEVPLYTCPPPPAPPATINRFSNGCRGLYTHH